MTQQLRRRWHNNIVMMTYGDDETAIRWRWHSDMVTMRQRYGDDEKAIRWQWHSDTVTMRQRYGDDDTSIWWRWDSDIVTMRQRYGDDETAIRWRWDSDMVTMKIVKKNMFVRNWSLVHSFRQFNLFYRFWLGLGRYSQYRYSIDTDINRYVSIRSSCCTDTDDGNSCKKTTNIPDLKLFVSHLIFIQFNKKAYCVWS